MNKNDVEILSQLIESWKSKSKLMHFNHRSQVTKKAEGIMLGRAEAYQANAVVLGATLLELIGDDDEKPETVPDKRGRETGSPAMGKENGQLPKKTG